MEHSRTITIDASPRKVWDVLADLERWPEWTKSITRVEVLDPGPLREGVRARLSVRGAPAGTWTVATATDGREFSWTFRAPGVDSLATHLIEPDGESSRVTLGVRQKGPVVFLLKPWLNHVANRNLEMEAAGLKRAAEAAV